MGPAVQGSKAERSHCWHKGPPPPHVLFWAAALASTQQAGGRGASHTSLSPLLLTGGRFHLVFSPLLSLSLLPQGFLANSSSSRTFHLCGTDARKRSPGAQSHWSPRVHLQPVHCDCLKATWPSAHLQAGSMPRYARAHISGYPQRTPVPLMLSLVGEF